MELNQLVKEEIQYDIVGIIRGALFNSAGDKVNNFVNIEEVIFRLENYYPKDEISKNLIELMNKNVLTTQMKGQLMLTPLAESISTKVIDPYWADRKDVSEYLYVVRNNLASQAGDEDWEKLGFYLESAKDLRQEDSRKYWMAYDEAYKKYGDVKLEIFEEFIEKFQETKVKIIESGYYTPPNSSTIDALEFLKPFWIVAKKTIEPFKCGEKYYDSIKKIYVFNKNKNLTDAEFVELLVENHGDEVKKNTKEILFNLNVAGLIDFYGNASTRYIRIVVNKKESMWDWKKGFLKYYFNPYYNYQPVVTGAGEIANSMAALYRSEMVPKTDSKENDYPAELTDSLKRFKNDHPNPNNVIFLMMKFNKSSFNAKVVKIIRGYVEQFGIKVLRADDKQYHTDLFGNVATYMHGCRCGIAIYEKLKSSEFNPNVSLEVGYMHALQKPVCLLKDKGLRNLHADLNGRLYKNYDPKKLKETIEVELGKWLRDWDVVRDK